MNAERAYQIVRLAGSTDLKPHDVTDEKWRELKEFHAFRKIIFGAKRIQTDISRGLRKE